MGSRASGVGRVLRCLAGLAVFGLGASSAGAQAPRAPVSAASPAAASSSPIEVGFEERVRSENWDNLLDHDAARDDVRRQWRFRTRVWTDMRVADWLTVHAGLGNESKSQTRPRVPLSRDETVIESLYVDLRPAGRLSARIGRQNLARGDGFILWDGTGTDGSRTSYLNAVDFSWAFAPKARLEVIGAWDPVHDEVLPVLDDKHKVLTEWDERLAGLYYTDTRRHGWDLQAYYFWKDERNDYRPVAHPQYQPERTVHTAGARLVRDLAPGLRVAGEWASQVGRQAAGAAIRAWGGTTSLRYAFEGPWKPALLGGYTALSGDDPATRTVERWDPIVSRWPKWSELYVHALTPEVGVGYWTNIRLWQAEATAAPAERLKIRGTYYHLAAFHPFAGSTATFGPGTRRGDLVQGRLDVALHEALKAHVLYERLIPGRFYAGTAPGYFFRVEFSYSVRKRFGGGGPLAARAR